MKWSVYVHRRSISLRILCINIQCHTELTELTDIISFDDTLSVLSVLSVCLIRDQQVILPHPLYPPLRSDANDVSNSGGRIPA